MDRSTIAGLCGKTVVSVVVNTKPSCKVTVLLYFPQPKEEKDTLPYHFLI